MNTRSWLVLLLFVPVLLLAQSDRGTITGTVADPTGAVVPGAALSLKNAETGAVYDSVTTETGNYTLPSLPSGNYELTVAQGGFRKYVRSGIQVQVATTLRVDVTLQLGAATETVIGPDVPRIQPYHVRRTAYCAFFAGAAGYAYGCDEVYGAESRRQPRPGDMSWKEALERPAASQMQHVRTLMESRPMLMLIPDQMLLYRS